MAARRLSPLASADPRPRRAPAPPRAPCASRSRRRRHDAVRRDATTCAAPVPRVVRLPRPTPLERWCREHGVGRGDRRRLLRARPAGTPLGELRTRGIARAPRARSTRRGATCAPACTSTAAACAIARRDELPAEPARRPAAGRPAARARRRAVRRRRRRGLLGGRAPVRLRHHRRPLPARGARRSRAAGALLAVACDGRADDEAGLTLAELAEALVALGARTGAQPRRRRLDLAGLRRAGCATSRARTHGVVLAGRAPGLDGADRVHAAR